MKTVLITGANRGIGLALAALYREKGCRVLGVCRQSSPELHDTGAEIVEGIDMTDIHAIASLQKKLSSTTIDILIANAGVHSSQRLGELDYDAILTEFQVNTLGPLRLVEALVSRMPQGGKIGLITSRMGSIEDNTSGASYAYRMSKCALNAAGKSLAHDLQPNGVSVALLHPGFVKTRMVNFRGFITPEESAAGLWQRLEDLTLKTSGQFWHADGEILPW